MLLIKQWDSHGGLARGARTDAEEGRAYTVVWAMFPTGGRFFLSFPILSCAFLCHFNVLPLHVELTRPTRKRMKIVIYSTMLTCPSRR